MPNPITAKCSSDLCRYYLDQLGWSWKHERVTDWLIRVQQHYNSAGWNYGEPIPEFVKIALAKYLDYRLKCQQLLNGLGWNWEHPTVLNIEDKFNCRGRLPLQGYKELFEELEEAHLIHF